MNWKKYVLATLAVFVATSVLNFLIHGFLLQPEYLTYSSLMRSPADSQSHAIFLLVSFLAFAPPFVWIYTCGVSDAPWVMQGIRYGMAMWVIASVSRYLTYYAIQPWSHWLVARQMLYELPMMLILGLLVASFYKPAKR
jgi:hypothetical protein